MLFTRLRYHFMTEAGRITSRAFHDPSDDFVDIRHAVPTWREAVYNKHVDKWFIIDRNIIHPMMEFPIGIEGHDFDKAVRKLIEFETDSYSYGYEPLFSPNYKAVPLIKAEQLLADKRYSLKALPL